MDTTKDVLKQTVENMEEETNQPATTNEEFVLEDQSIISDEYFEKTCEEIAEMNFIEVKKINKEFLFQKDSLEKAKESVEQIMELRKATEDAAESNADLANAIIDADAEMNTGIENITEFLNSYDDTMSKLNALIEKSEERLHAFDNVEVTTKYLNDSML